MDINEDTIDVCGMLGVGLVWAGLGWVWRSRDGGGGKELASGHGKQKDNISRKILIASYLSCQLKWHAISAPFEISIH